MGAELRIEGDDIVRMAQELAELRGMSVPDAVVEALHQRLMRGRDVRERADRMLAMGRRVRALINEPINSNHDWLYDEDGLPG